MEALQLLSRSEMKQIKGGYMLPTCQCYYNDCLVTITQGGDGWNMIIFCDGNDDPNEYDGSGAYGGTVCGGECP